VIVQATYVFASAMIVESILSFLGAGTPPTIPSWGNMLAEARQFITRAPWLLFFPGMMIGFTALALNLVGDALRDRLDPRFRAMLGGEG
jgi:peptide/nickel transport system permease protein